MADLKFRIQKTFITEENHKKAIEFLLDSELGTFIQMQTKDNINELTIVLEEYHQMKLEDS